MGTAMNHTTPTGDPVELLHLALDAMDRGLSTEAMQHLRRLLMIRPGSAEGHYLLGMQQAKQGMTGRAIASLRTAIAFQPDLDVARFRLGMLLASSGQTAEAKAIWEPLNALHPDDPFYLFKTGLLSLAEGNAEQCISYLRLGMSLNHLNPSLNEDMATVIEDIRFRQPEGQPRSAGGRLGFLAMPAAGSVV